VYVCVCVRVCVCVLIIINAHIMYIHTRIFVCKSAYILCCTLLVLTIGMWVCTHSAKEPLIIGLFCGKDWWLFCGITIGMWLCAHTLSTSLSLHTHKLSLTHPRTHAHAYKHTHTHKMLTNTFGPCLKKTKKQELQGKA